MAQALDPLAVAQELARALDESAFERVRALLAPDCRYAINGRELCGVQAIVASYADNAAWGARTLDALRFTSQVTAADGGAEIEFVDEITHRGAQHVYRCRQRVWVDARGRVVRIEHADYAGERARLDAFFERVGVVRD